MVSMLRANGNRIKVLRIQRGWPQEQLARVADISPRTVQRVEAGGNASFETLRSLAAAFEIDVTGLLEAGGKMAVESSPAKAPSIDRLARLIAWLLPYMPAIKTTLGSAAVVLLLAFAIRLSPFLANIEPAIELAESAVASAQFCPEVPLTMKIEQPREFRRNTNPLALESRGVEGKSKPAESGAAINPANTSGIPPQHDETLPLGHLIAVSPAPAFERTSAGPTTIGTNDIDWLTGLSDFEPAGIFRTSKTSFEAIAAQHADMGLSSIGTRHLGWVSSGASGGRGPVSRTFVRSGKSTAAFFTKVGSSIKRAF